MELVINKKSIRPKLTNTFKIVINFMEGDADGDQAEKFYFHEDKLNNTKTRDEIFDFIKSIQSCVELDDQGRCGFEWASECINWYGAGLDRCSDESMGKTYQWSRFCIDSENDPELSKELKLEPSDEYSNFLYNIPTYSGGWYTSYESIEIFYYDEYGDCFEVIIID